MAKTFPIQKFLQKQAFCRATLICIAVFSFSVNASGPNMVMFDENIPAAIPDSILADWRAQDGAETGTAGLAGKIRASLPQEYAVRIDVADSEEAYRTACHWRRVSRIKPFADRIGKLIYARHHDIGGPIYGFVEDLNSDGIRGLGPWGFTASKSNDYLSGNRGGTAIHLLTFNDYYPRPDTLVADSVGCLRDPCPTPDARKIVFAWSKDNNGYSIYDLDVATGSIRQLTADPENIKVSDFQPCVTPDGDIIFNSSRVFSMLSHNINLVSNLFIMNRDGKYLRRIGYDQAHTFCPTLMDDGRIMYCRMEFNDRNLSNCKGIFTMEPDGSHQAGLYGTQTPWPSLILQSAPVPNSGKILSIIGGHMGPFAGDLALINLKKGRDGAAAVSLVAPERPNPQEGAVSMDGVPDSDKLFQNPLPLDESWFLISWRPDRKARFSVVLMNLKGEHELLAWDDVQSVSQPQLLCERSVSLRPHLNVDYTKSTGSLAVHNAYEGLDTDSVSVAAGTIGKLRIVALEYRTEPPFGSTGAQSYYMSPVGRFGCTVDAKRIIGETAVATDGSTAFTVPARTPVFFQLVDTNGILVQSMRSWVTLQPGERYDCRGCHATDTLTETQRAASRDFRTPLPVHGIADDHLYYPEHIQPILDAKCVRCHDATHSKGVDLRGDRIWTNDLSDGDNKNAYRFWCGSYLRLTVSSYVSSAIFGPAEAIPPYSFGSSKSPLIAMLRKGHKDLTLSAEELGRLCVWMDLGYPHSGTYADDMRPEDSLAMEKRFDRLRVEEAIEARNINQFIQDGQWKYFGCMGCGDVPEIPEAVGYREKGGRVTGDFSVRVANGNFLVATGIPSNGTISILDMHGRLLARFDAGRENRGGMVRLNQKAYSPGLYLVRFKGDNFSAQRTVAIH